MVFVEAPGFTTRISGYLDDDEVIYYYLEADDQVWVITVYDKNEMADLSLAEKRLLKKAAEKELA